MIRHGKDLGQRCSPEKVFPTNEQSDYSTILIVLEKIKRHIIIINVQENGRLQELNPLHYFT